MDSLQNNHLLKKIKLEEQQKNESSSLQPTQTTTCSTSERIFPSECSFCKENRKPKKKEIVSVLKKISELLNINVTSSKDLRDINNASDENIFHIVIKNLKPFDDASLCTLLHIPQLKRKKNSMNYQAMTPLCLGSNYGNLSLIKFLLSHEFEMDNLCVQWTPLSLSVKNGFFHQTKFLIEKGAYLNCFMEFTPLMHAVKNNDLKIIKLLVESGANVNTTGRKGWSPLILASVQGYAEVTDYLLKNGADITDVTSVSNSCLVHAAWNGHIGVICLLLERDPYFYLKMEKGKEQIKEARKKVEVRKVQFSVSPPYLKRYKKISSILSPENIEWYCRRDREKLAEALRNEEGNINSLFYAKHRFRGNQVLAPLPREFVKDVMREVCLFDIRQE